MRNNSLSISTQNKLILLGLVISTVLIVGLAVFAITNIQQKISEVYGGFGEILTKTLAIVNVLWHKISFTCRFNNSPKALPTKNGSPMFCGRIFLFDII